MKNIVALIFTALFATAIAGPMVNVVDTKNRMIYVELLALNETHATVKRASDDKTFKLALSSLSAESVKTLKKKQSEIPVAYPKIEVTVSIGNRRVKKSGSFYMKSQNISTTISIRNLDLEKDYPKRPARIVYFGQDTSNPDRYSILAINQFEVAPTANKTAEAVLPSFNTSYDSDNMGFGNIGGYQYEGFLFVIWDDDKQVIYHKTTNATVAKAVKMDSSLLDRMITAKKGTVLGKNLTSLSKPKKSGSPTDPIIVE